MSNTSSETANESLFLSTSHTTWEGKDKFASTVHVQGGKCCWETEKEEQLFSIFECFMQQCCKCTSDI